MRHAARLTACALGCDRGGRAVFRDLTFAAAPGEAWEVRGPNGAGKSSLLRLIAGLLAPAAGSVEIDDPGRPHDEGREASLLYLGHHDGVKAAETVRDQLRLWADVFGTARERADAALDAVGLSRLAGRAGGTLSAGQRRRAALARLVLIDRPVWLLDEPAAPLDADGRRLLGDLIDAHRAAGGVVIAAAHDPLPGAPARVLAL